MLFLSKGADYELAKADPSLGWNELMASHEEDEHEVVEDEEVEEEGGA